MDSVIKALVYVGRLQQALRDLNDKLGQTGLPTTLWFDIIPSESGVLVQGFLDVELPNGNALSHDLDFVAIGSKCCVSTSQIRITPEGSDILKSTGEMECTTIQELGSAMSACERFIQEISISDIRGESCGSDSVAKLTLT